MQEKIRSVEVHKAIRSIELGLYRRVLFDQITSVDERNTESVCVYIYMGYI